MEIWCGIVDFIGGRINSSRYTCCISNVALYVVSALCVLAFRFMALVVRITGISPLDVALFVDVGHSPDTYTQRSGASHYCSFFRLGER